MAGDGVRMDAYARAIARVVKPGSIVLDLGAGTGILSLLAVRAGAKRVHAVDPNPAIWLVPEIASANEAAGIVVHARSSLDLTLAEPADVVVSDLRGTTPLNDDHVDAIRDARARLLRPGGVLVPAKDRLFVAPVESVDLWRSLARGWETFERLGFDARAARTSVLNSFYNDSYRPLAASDLLTAGASWAELEYATYEAAPLEGTVEMPVTRSGVAHGLAVWFEATVHEDIRYTTAPGHQLAYGRAFLPLLEPVPLACGDCFTVTMRADARGTRWAWDSEVRDATGARRAKWRQSTFFGAPTAPESLLRSSSTYKPKRSSRGERLLSILSALDGACSVEEIAAAIEAKHPSGALGAQRTLEDVQRIVSDYGT